MAFFPRNIQWKTIFLIQSEYNGSCSSPLGIPKYSLNQINSIWPVKGSILYFSLLQPTMISNYGKMFVGYFGYMYVLPLLSRHQILDSSELFFYLNHFKILLPFSFSKGSWIATRGSRKQLAGINFCPLH